MAEEGRNNGVIVEPLFVACTRPSTFFGVPLYAFVVELVVVVEGLVWSKNVLSLGLFLPAHLIIYLLVRKDIRAMELAALWMMTKAHTYFESLMFWGVSTKSPLPLHISRPSRYFKKTGIK